MRKNTVEAFNAWQQGKGKKPARSIWTDGKIVYSYTTPIITVKAGVVMVNSRSYSRTTSNHQSSLHALLKQSGTHFELCEPSELF